ncbi:STAS domain-containing protein [Streptomyces minutiscleroticus]|uniref:STAS domain-containing protein n=1 Tax=Streptomyces minutiscleroticus TaxID=68238 RepID=UPI00167D150B|nr:STAS domain-containing protein [Streptomyces minutiscleroticus]
MIRTVHGGVTVLSPQGEIDLHTAHRLRQVLTADRDHCPTRVVVDLRWVIFMDFSGINALIDLYRATRDRPGWLRLSGIQAPVWRIVQLSGLDVVLDCYPTVHRALTR